MSLYDLLSSMGLKRKAPVKRNTGYSKQALAVIEILNVNLGCEMETVEIARLAEVKRDSALAILTRLEKTFDITSKITTSSERKKGKHSKTKVKKWTCHKLIGTK